MSFEIKAIDRLAPEKRLVASPMLQLVLASIQVIEAGINSNLAQL